MGVLHGRNQTGLLRQLPYDGSLCGLARLDTATGQLPHAPDGTAQKDVSGGVGDHGRSAHDRLRGRPALIHRGERPARPSQHQHRQALRVEPRRLLETVRDLADLVLVQGDMPTLLRGVVHDRRDDDDRTALTQPRSQSAQDARSRLDERSTQTQGDQVVAAFFPRGRAGQRVMFDVQAQPAHPSRLGAPHGSGRGHLG